MPPTGFRRSCHLLLSSKKKTFDCSCEKFPLFDARPRKTTF